MNALHEKPDLTELNALYDEVELAILFDWLGLTRPDALSNINIESSAGEDEDVDTGPVRVVPNMYGDYSEHALSNAVARLVLSEIQGRLPQWGCVDGNGLVTLARSYSPRRHAKVELLPRFLFEINWADSGPGFSWPEAYHLAYLPGFDRYLVTASQDSPEAHGYTDEAIGHFSPDESVEVGIHRIIVDWWDGQARGWDQHRWAYLFGTGDVDAEEALSWADQVWDRETGEPLAKSA
jgi:hypothetical protein